MNARQKRLFEDARKRNPELKIPLEVQPVTDWTEADLALQSAAGSETAETPAGEQTGSVVTYFEAKGFGFLRPDDGGRDIFFHVSRLAEGLATDLRPGTRLIYELGMDRTGKMAAASIRIAPEQSATRG